eukprot:300250_1
MDRLFGINSITQVILIAILLVFSACTFNASIHLQNIHPRGCKYSTTPTAEIFYTRFKKINEGRGNLIFVFDDYAFCLGVKDCYYYFQNYAGNTESQNFKFALNERYFDTFNTTKQFKKRINNVTVYNFTNRDIMTVELSRAADTLNFADVVWF